MCAALLFVVGAKALVLRTHLRKFRLSKVRPEMISYTSCISDSVKRRGSSAAAI